MKKQILILLLAFIASISASAHDFEAPNSDGVTIYYNQLTSNSVEVTYRGNSYDNYNNEYSGNITIPSTVTYSGVTYRVGSIGIYAFKDCSNLTAVTLPNSVTSIGSGSFSGCTGLIEVNLPNSVTSIGSQAFEYCSALTSVTIPNSVTSMGDGPFTYCTGMTAFYGKYASSDNRCLIVDGTLNSFAPAGLTNYTIPNNVTKIGNYAFEFCRDLTTVTIPNSVTSIGIYAFDACRGLTSLTLPNSVTSIGYEAFGYCSGLTSMKIPNTVTTIESSTFSGCTSLKSVIIPSSITKIDRCAFYGCTGLKEIYSYNAAPNNITLGSMVFFNVPTSTCVLYVPTNAVTLYQAADQWKAFKNIQAITDPNQGLVFSLNDDGVSYSVTGTTDDLPAEVVIPATYEGQPVTAIGDWAFENCSGLISVTIPNSITSIGSHAFYGCSGLTSMTIPESVTSIDGIAFGNCSGLKSVTIPESVTSIGYGAFDGCSCLTEVNVSDLAAWCHIAFGDCGANPLDYAHNLYLNGEKIEHLEIPESITKILQYSFYNCSSLTSVTIPNSVTTIGAGAFHGCSGLTSMTIPNSVTSIDGIAFGNCSGLKSVTIPESVTSIGYGAFDGCSGLTNIRSEITDLDNLSMGLSVFYRVPTSACKLSVPRSKQSVYSSTAPWSEFTNIVEHFITGDANIDYGVTVADVSTTISHILGNNPSTFDEEAADVNGNGKVNVADATLITNIVLNQPSVAFALPARMPAMFEQASNASLSMSDVAIDELIGHVSVDNASDFVALQFEVNVPDGLTIENVSSDENHTVAFNSIGDNVYRVIIYSLANTPFQSDEVASFSFRQNGNVEVGSEIDFSSVLVNENINGEINEYQIVATPAYVTEWSSIQHIINMDTKIRVKNGELLIDADSECDVRIVSIDGIVIIKHLIPGTNSISLPKGLYIINGVKVLL